MSKKIIFILLTFGCLQAVKGQFKIQFQSATDNKAVADVSVHLVPLPVPAHGKPGYIYLISDNMGIVEVSKGGKYLLQLNHIGYKPMQDTIMLTANNVLKVQLTASEYIMKEDVVVTGVYEITTTDKSLNKVRVIDSKKIEKQGAVNLRDILTNELNIRLSQDNVLGTSLSLQGIAGQNIKILIDGVPVIGRNDGSIDISQINLANIERIEIIEGPMSVMYGTDALGGVINLITKKSVNHTIEAGLSAFHENNGNYNIDGRFAIRKKSKFIQVSGGRYFFEGKGFYPEVRSKTWKPKEQYFVDVTTGIKIKNSLHRLQLSYFDEKLTNKGEPVFTPYSVKGLDEYFITLRAGASMFTDFRLNNRATLNFVNSYSFFSRTKDTQIKDLVNLRSSSSPSPEAHDTAVFDLFLFRGIYTSGGVDKKVTFQAGYDINIEKASGKRLLETDPRIGDFAVFTTMEIKPILRLSIKPGVRAIYNTRYGAPVVPSLNLKYDLTEKWAIRGSYARGFRAPSLKELNLFFVDINHNIQGNNTLKAENSNNFSLSSTYIAKSAKWNFKLDPTVFYNNITDMISLAMVDASRQLYTYINVADFTSAGFNINADAKKEGFTLTAGYALTGRKNILEGPNINRYNMSSEYRANVSYTIPKINADISVFYKYTGVLPGYATDETGAVYATKVDGYSTMDASISKQFWKRRIQVITGLKNIFDITNINFSGTSGGGTHTSGGSSLPVSMGRTVFVNLRFNFVSP